MTKSDYREIFRILAANNPKPTTELQYSSTFELLVAVMLSAQATDISVNKATKTLYACAKTPKQILDLGEEGLIKHIKSIGLYRNKAKNILKTCQIILDKYAGEVPKTRDELVKLPGVGRKTANVVLNTAYGEPVIAIDTHIFRVANRTGMAKGKTTLIVEQKLEKRVPTEFLLDAHHWLILHGRYVCKARNPECDKCKIYNYCKWTKKPK
ncbi:MAG: endonuclease III [Pseudomonadota bacterium]|nr:endonuclease III [Pseudomonadota bacterium]